MKMKFSENPELSPVEWIRVSAVEDATINHDVTIGVPRGLSDEEVIDFLYEERIQRRIYKEENRTVESLGDLDFDWEREGM
jgi:hypothetical protein